MEILLLFVSLVANLLFSYIGLWAGAKLTSRKKLAAMQQLALYMYTIAAMVAAIIAAFLFVPLGVVVLFIAMFIGVRLIAGFSSVKSAQYAMIYTTVVVVLSSLESYLVSALLFTK